MILWRKRSLFSRVATVIVFEILFACVGDEIGKSSEKNKKARLLAYGDVSRGFYIRAPMSHNRYNMVCSHEVKW